MAMQIARCLVVEFTRQSLLLRLHAYLCSYQCGHYLVPDASLKLIQAFAAERNGYRAHQFVGSSYYYQTLWQSNFKFPATIYADCA